MASYEGTSSVDRWVTRRNVTKKVVEWTINDFSMLNMKTGKCIKSPDFVVGDDDNVKWFLTLYPNGYSDKYKDFVSFFLNCSSSKSVDAYYEIILKNLKEKHFPTAGEINNYSVLFPSYGYHSLIKRDELKDGSLNDDMLCLTFTVKVFSKHATVIPNIHASSEQKLAPASYLSNKFAAVFESQKCTDVTLKIEGREINAHKVVLVASSDVFEAMFKPDTSEAQTGIVRVEDVEYDTIMTLVQFLYTGEVQSFDNAEGLLVAADKYNVGPLKTLCERHLASHITADYVVHLLQFSETHNAQLLKDQAISFAVSNRQDVLDRDDWITFEEQFPRIANEVLKKALLLKV